MHLGNYYKIIFLINTMDNEDTNFSSPPLERDIPEIVCLCGSTKFKDEFRSENKRLTMNGKIVLSVSFFGHADDIDLSDDEKRKVDKLHKRKIDISDRVHVIDVNGYVGESTRSEIEYAKQSQMPITWYSDQ